jgi:hypothetical protein
MQVIQSNRSELPYFLVLAMARYVDQASSCGWLAYSTFDHDWVKQQIETTSVNTVLEKNWPGLHIEPYIDENDLRTHHKKPGPLLVV